MLIKIQNIFCLVSILIFITLTASFYFSDQNIRATNKSRSFYAVKLLHDTLKLPLLANDTKGIIEYRLVVSRKERIWEGLIINLLSVPKVRQKNTSKKINNFHPT